MTTNDPVVERFDKGRHIREGFDCGDADLNDWLHRHASPAEKVNSARVYVFHEGDRLVRAYYTLCVGSLRRDEAPPKLQKGQPTSVSAVLLGRFAVDRGFQNRGLGAQLLGDALGRAMRINESAAVACVMLDAKNDRVRAWYEKIGFIRSPMDAYRLVMPMKDIKRNRTHGR